MVGALILVFICLFFEFVKSDNTSLTMSFLDAIIAWWPMVQHSGSVEAPLQAWSCFFKHGIVSPEEEMALFQSPSDWLWNTKAICDYHTEITILRLVGGSCNTHIFQKFPVYKIQMTGQFSCSLDLLKKDLTQILSVFFQKQYKCVLLAIVTSPIFQEIYYFHQKKISDHFKIFFLQTLKRASPPPFTSTSIPLYPNSHLFFYYFPNSFLQRGTQLISVQNIGKLKSPIQFVKEERSAHSCKIIISFAFLSQL